MKLWLILSVLFRVIYLSKAVVPAEASHWYTIDLFQHLLWNQTCVQTAAIPVPSASTKNTAYFLQGKERCLEVDGDFLHTTVKQVIQDARELTILTAVKQEPQNTGTIMSFYADSQRYFELESSGRRNELRLHFIHKQRSVSEVFPHQLADNQWHTIALSFTDTFLQLFIDCEKVFERRIPIMDFSFLKSDGVQLWLGQRNENHGYFKGSIEYVKLLNSPEGYLTQCPYADVACPTCGEYKSLKETVSELYTMVHSLHLKLESQEERLEQLEECECRRVCDVNGIKYRDGESWQKDHCTTCTCRGGEVHCTQPKCGSVTCKNPVLKEGQCCPECLRRCYHNNAYYDDGESFITSGRLCARCLCQDGSLACFNIEKECEPLMCPVHEQISVEGQCCKVCSGSGGGQISPVEIDHCAQGNKCHPNATCVNLSNRYTCKCKTGFDGNEKYCRDIDECLQEGGERGHHCNTYSSCVNTIGSYSCQCQKGYVKLDPYTCREHNECDTGAHTCASQAQCENSEGAYSCHCLPGYDGDGFTCTPVCEGGCDNGGECVSPGTCQCRKGFYGRNCHQDLDECRLGISRCHPNSVCINIPGDYLCECQPGYKSAEGDNRNGWLCKDLDECRGYGGGHKCSEGRLCENTEGSYQCVCTDPSQCRKDCYVHGEPVAHGSIWPSVDDVCSECRCNNGRVECKASVCDCDAAGGVDYRCCPQCQPQNQCPHQNLPLTYHSGETWTYQCQTCQCMGGETDCWRLECPPLACSPTIQLAGDCCPRCAQDTDPCLAGADHTDTKLVAGYLISKETCEFGGKIYRSGDEWKVPAVDRCTQCTCKNGHVCCSHNLGCLQDPRYSRRLFENPQNPAYSNYRYNYPYSHNNNDDASANNPQKTRQNNLKDEDALHVLSDSNSVRDTGQAARSGGDDNRQPIVDINAARVQQQEHQRQGLSRDLSPHVNNGGVGVGESRGARRNRDSRRRSNHRRSRGHYRGGGDLQSREDLDHRTYSLRRDRG